MRTSTTSKSRKKSANRSRNESDALELLKSDHAKVKKMFKQFEKMKEDQAGDDEKAELAEQICRELIVHAQLEEEIFYPAVRQAMDEPDVIDEAEVEHATAKDLIAQIEEMSPGDELFDAKVTVLGEYINHHVEEEEGEMFRMVKKAKVDTEELGSQIMERKSELAPEESEQQQLKH